ncbi:hypothetical protein ACFE04_026948 [Oxalis oulophora]
MMMDTTTRPRPSTSSCVLETLQQLHNRTFSILSVSGPWKDQDQDQDQEGSNRNQPFLVMEETIKQMLGLLEERVEKVRIAQFDLLEKERDLGVLANSISEKYSDLMEKETEVSRKLERLKVCEEDLNKRIKDVDLISKSNDASSKQIDAEYQTLAAKSESLSLWEKNLVDMRSTLDSDAKLLEDRVRTFELREQRFNEQSKILELKDVQLGQKLNESEGTQRKLNGEKDTVDSKDKQIEEQLQKVQGNSQLEVQNIELVSKRMEIEKLSQQLGLKEIEDQTKDLKLLEKQITEKFADLMLEGMRNHEVAENLKKREDDVNKQFRELALKEKQLDDERSREHQICSEVKTDPIGKCSPLNGSPNIQCALNMDGKGLQVLLNKMFKDHDCMQNEVLMILGLSSNPAMLVLHALEGFYPPHLKNGDIEFEEHVVRSTCNLLLEQLLKLSPEIKDDVKKEAFRVASAWLKKMNADAEILGFSQLVEAFGLTGSFDAAVLFNNLNRVAHNSLVLKLLRILGSGVIKGFIQNLVEKERHFLAIMFVLAFELTAQYPPVSLLKDYLKRSENNASKVIVNGLDARNRRIADLKDILNCFEYYNLQSEYPADYNNFRMQLHSLVNEPVNDQKTLQTPLSNINSTPTVLPSEPRRANVAEAGCYSSRKTQKSRRSTIGPISKPMKIKKRNTNGKKMGVPISKQKCYFCRKYGHYRMDCPAYKKMEN